MFTLVSPPTSESCVALRFRWGVTQTKGQGKAVHLRFGQGKCALVLPPGSGWQSQKTDRGPDAICHP